MTRWLLAALLILLSLWYLSFTATRLDRLHHRVETSWANLDVLLQKRAAVCLLYTSPSPRDRQKSRMPSSA